MQKVILICFYAFLQLTLQAQEKAELVKKRKQTLQEIEILNRQYNEIKKSKKQSIGQLSLIQNKIRLRNEVIGTINKQVLTINKDISGSYVEMRRLKRDLDTLKLNYSRNVIYAYKNRSSYDFLNFLFSANSFNDAIRRVSYMKAYRSHRAQQLIAIYKTESLYRSKIVELTNNKQQKSLVLQDETQEKAELEKDKQEQAVIVNDIKKKEGEINQSLAAKKKQSIQLQNAIAAAIKREINEAKIAAEKKRKEEAERIAAEKIAKAKAKAKANNTTSNTNTGSTTAAVTKPETTKPVENKNPTSFLEFNKEDIALGASFEANRGRLPFPVDNGYISGNFGRNTIPETNIVYDQDFITISSPAGTSVKACFDGEVSSIFDVAGNAAVMIQHGKYFTTYSNLVSTNVTRGQKVRTGQIIGKVGTNLDGDGELNFVLARESQMINPAPWLRGR